MSEFIIAWTFLVITSDGVTAVPDITTREACVQLVNLYRERFAWQTSISYCVPTYVQAVRNPAYRPPKVEKE